MKFKYKYEMDFWCQVFMAYVQGAERPSYEGSSGRALKAHLAEHEADAAVKMLRERAPETMIRDA